VEWRFFLVYKILMEGSVGVVSEFVNSTVSAITLSSTLCTVRSPSQKALNLLNTRMLSSRKTVPVCTELLAQANPSETSRT
jgi:hypothetical protein